MYRHSLLSICPVNYLSQWTPLILIKQVRLRPAKTRRSPRLRQKSRGWRLNLLTTQRLPRLSVITSCRKLVTTLRWVNNIHYFISSLLNRTNIELELNNNWIVHCAATIFNENNKKKVAIWWNLLSRNFKVLILMTRGLLNQTKTRKTF